jgi:NitT/TauT family transport system permease protein
LPTTRAYPETAGQQLEQGWRFGWVDAVIIMAVCVLLWLLAVLGGDMRVRFDELNPPAISLDLE